MPRLVPKTFFQNLLAGVLTGFLACASLTAQTEREIRVRAKDGKLSVLALTRALLTEYGYAGDAVVFPDVTIDVSGVKGTLLLKGLSKALGDTTRLRKSKDGDTLLITIDQQRARALRHKLKNKVAIALSALTGKDILARRYALAVPEGLAADATWVLCVHGLDSSARTWDSLRKKLDLPSGTFDYANDEAVDRIAEELAQRLRARAKQFPRQRIVIIAHSMGGLVSRHVLETAKLDPGNVVTLIMLGTPNQGSRLSRLRSGSDLLEYFRDQGDRPRVLAPWLDGMGEAGWDLWPNSPFLTGLNQKKRNANVRYHLLLGNHGVMGKDEFAAQRAGVLAKVKRWKKSEVYLPKVASWLDDLGELVHGQGDGAVSLERGKLDGVRAVVMPVTHLGMLRDAKVAEQVAEWVAASKKR